MFELPHKNQRGKTVCVRACVQHHLHLSKLRLIEATFTFTTVELPVSSYTYNHQRTWHLFQWVLQRKHCRTIAHSPSKWNIQLDTLLRRGYFCVQRNPSCCHHKRPAGRMMSVWVSFICMNWSTNLEGLVERLHATAASMLVTASSILAAFFLGFHIVVCSTAKLLVQIFAISSRHHIWHNTHDNCVSKTPFKTKILGTNPNVPTRSNRFIFTFELAQFAWALVFLECERRRRLPWSFSIERRTFLTLMPARPILVARLALARRGAPPTPECIAYAQERSLISTGYWDTQDQ